MESFLRTVRTWEGGRKEIEMAIKVDDTAGEVENAEDMLMGLMPELPHFIKFSR